MIDFSRSCNLYTERKRELINFRSFCLYRNGDGADREDLNSKQKSAAGNDFFISCYLYRERGGERELRNFRSYYLYRNGDGADTEDPTATRRVEQVTIARNVSFSYL